jgi:beta-phosphoglucomutase
MNWISKFQLFLFDFDGLLVNTEILHLEAYRRVCLQRGFVLDWDLKRFVQAAHVDAVSLRHDIYRELPDLYLQEPKWDVIYAEKKAMYQKLLHEGELQLMPGVADLLTHLHRANIRRCVVTHALKAQTDLIRSKIPLLETIPVWITRENYQEPKPSPQCYQKALQMLKKKGDRTIGFEDSLRGLKAMIEAGVDRCVWVSEHTQLKTLPSNVACYTSITDVHEK